MALPVKATVDPRPDEQEALQLERIAVIGYASVTDDERSDSRHVEEQADAIASLCDEHGWDLVEVVRDVEPAVDRPLERPGVRYAFDRIGRGDASCLVAAELGRLSHSPADLSRILEALGTSGARLVAIDVGLDTASPDARVAINALTAMGDRSEATRTPARAAALRAVQAQTAGRVAEDPIAVKQRIARMREGGMTLQAIADQLNDEAVPTLGGGTKWRPSSVRYAVASIARTNGGSLTA
jgi:DNA invertase Pin-like site-specific DNA recombinase